MTGKPWMRKEIEMRKSVLSREPQKADVRNWYYEDPEGLLVIHEVVTPQGRHIQTDQFLIPWKMVRVSVQRYHKAMKKAD